MMIAHFSDGYGSFPEVTSADEDGLLAVGATLATDRLLFAYRNGIFPWYDRDSPVLWYAPDPRFVLFPPELKVSKSLKQVLRNGDWTVTGNQVFEQVVRNCASVDRKDQDGTWIHEEMIEAYTGLHRSGYAQSIEVWQQGRLAGGLYGVTVGKVFCGESMFSLVSNASKVALTHLCLSGEYDLIDCQVYTEHLSGLGARMISRSRYLEILAAQEK